MQENKTVMLFPNKLEGAPGSLPQEAKEHTASGFPNPLKQEKGMGGTPPMSQYCFPRLVEFPVYYGETKILA